jgi:hypothetical protein
LVAICFPPSLADSFLTLTQLVVVFIFVNFSFALFTPPLGDYQSPSWVTAGGGVQPGCMMKIFEAERWLKGTNSHGVASLQRRGKKTAGIPHPGAWKVERCGT